MEANGYSSRTVFRRLPRLFGFTEFAQKRGCTDVASAFALVEGFVSEWLVQHGPDLPRGVKSMCRSRFPDASSISVVEPARPPSSSAWARTEPAPITCLPCQSICPEVHVSIHWKRVASRMHCAKYLPLLPTGVKTIRPKDWGATFAATRVPEKVLVSRLSPSANRCNNVPVSSW
jgi:hypothetical protein